ncbi:MAG: fused MFS/spermidine synthase [Planctomycetota bacterium]|nr:MAG: fused MFS/spermidine synthase [Planctomycetota bacterium]
MVLELVAGRLVARHLGSSLYTWTSVIGVVLSGITIGNYLGGRIADRFPARKALSVLFCICSAACVGTVILNNLVGELMFLWYFRWPLRVFSHVFLVFLIPSTLLGTISPVVAKMALEQGLPTGRTVGDIYAWGAAGSIVGTFLAGFYLIAAMGTIAIIWTVGAALLAMAILYWARLWALYVWAAIFITLVTMGMAPIRWAESVGSSLALRAKHEPNIIYEDESQYNYIAVKQVSRDPDKRIFVQDKLTHSVITMDDVKDLKYIYAKIYAAITHRLNPGKEKLSAFGIGGGGYVFPRYVEQVWPGSRVDVAEIDPGVTEAAMQAFGLDRDTTINIFTMDARNYIDSLLELMRSGEQVPRYDFIYADAFNDYSVPYQLVTKEFNDKIAQILKDDGVYMLNLVDTYNGGQFLGSIINTLEKTFDTVHVLSEIAPLSVHHTFVVVGSKQEINIDGLINQCNSDIDIWYLNKAEINALKQQSRGIILTDDYVPTENMLVPVVQQSTVEFLSSKYENAAEKLKRWGKLDESIATYKELIKFNPTTSISAYSRIAETLEEQGKLKEAAESLRLAIKYNEQAETQVNIADVHLDLGLLLKALHRPKESREHFRTAIKGFREKLDKNPNAIEIVIGLGISLVEIGELSEATKYLRLAIKLDPLDVEKRLMLAQALVMQELYDEVIKQLHKDIEFMLGQGRKEEATMLQELLESSELEKSKRKK